MTATRDEPSATGTIAGLEVRPLRTEREFVGVLDIRRRVFGEEQGLVATGINDRDDARSTHVVAVVGGVVVGSGRLTPNGDWPRQAMIAWVATLPDYRGLGVGSAVVRRLLAVADETGFEVVTLSAQTHALAFYRRLGFAAYGRRFVVAGVEHQMMSRARPNEPERLTPVR